MVRIKARTKKDRDLLFLQETLEHRRVAVKEGAKVKNFNIRDLKVTKPLTYGQEQMFTSYLNGNNIVANGSAGTGKTYCGIYLALVDLLSEKSKQNEIIIVRSAAATRDIGHLPGEITDKLAPYEEPYRNIVGSLLRKNEAYDILKKNGRIRFVATSFIRGLTWDNAVIVVDEMQSMTFHEINSIMTRLGDNSRLIMCGDITQNDLIVKKTDQSGYRRALNALGAIDTVDIITFTRDDIVRSKFVKQWICAVEDSKF